MYEGENGNNVKQLSLCVEAPGFGLNTTCACFLVDIVKEEVGRLLLTQASKPPHCRRSFSLL